MKTTQKLKKVAALVLTAVTLTAVAGCSGKTENVSAADKGGAKTIRIGTGTGYYPYCYLDDDGNLAGYEKAVLDAVDELLPQYEFVYETFDFKNILLSIDAGKIDIGAHQFEQNPDRLSNYTFGEVPYTTYVRYITVLNENNVIKSIDDLGGRPVQANVGDNATYFFEAWNAEHPDNPMKLDVTEGISEEERVAGFKSGKWEAFSSTKRDVDSLNEAYGNIFKRVGEPHINSNSYFVFKKGNTELQKEIDAAVKKLKDSGKLAELSIVIIGGDFTESE